MFDPRAIALNGLEGGALSVALFGLVDAIAEQEPARYYGNGRRESREDEELIAQVLDGWERLAVQAPADAPTPRPTPRPAPVANDAALVLAAPVVEAMPVQRVALLPQVADEDDEIALILAALDL